MLFIKQNNNIIDTFNSFISQITLLTSHYFRIPSRVVLLAIELFFPRYVTTTWTPSISVVETHCSPEGIERIGNITLGGNK